MIMIERETMSGVKRRSRPADNHGFRQHALQSAKRRQHSFPCFAFHDRLFVIFAHSCFISQKAYSGQFSNHRAAKAL